MNLRRKGMLGLIGAIAVFAIVSVCFSNCSSEDDFGEMEEMEYTMASKKMTRFEPPAPPEDDSTDSIKTYSGSALVDFTFLTGERYYNKKLNVELNITTTMNDTCTGCNATITGGEGFSITSASASLTERDTVKSTVKFLVHINAEDDAGCRGLGDTNITFDRK